MCIFLLFYVHKICCRGSFKHFAHMVPICPKLCPNLMQYITRIKASIYNLDNLTKDFNKMLLKSTSDSWYFESFPLCQLCVGCELVPILELKKKLASFGWFEKRRVERSKQNARTYAMSLINLSSRSRHPRRRHTPVRHEYVWECEDNFTRTGFESYKEYIGAGVFWNLLLWI
jgi:hypothetical protein